MRFLFATLLAVMAFTPNAFAQQHDGCAVPGYLLYGDSALQRVSAAVQKKQPIKIVVVGTGSSLLPGQDGVNTSYPARLEQA